MDKSENKIRFLEEILEKVETGEQLSLKEAFTLFNPSETGNSEDYTAWETNVKFGILITLTLHYKKTTEHSRQLLTKSSLLSCLDEELRGPGVPLWKMVGSLSWQDKSLLLKNTLQNGHFFIETESVVSAEYKNLLGLKVVPQISDTSHDAINTGNSSSFRCFMYKDFQPREDKKNIENFHLSHRILFKVTTNEKSTEESRFFILRENRFAENGTLKRFPPQSIQLNHLEILLDKIEAKSKLSITECDTIASIMYGEKSHSKSLYYTAMILSAIQVEQEHIIRKDENRVAKLNKAITEQQIEAELKKKGISLLRFAAYLNTIGRTLVMTPNKSNGFTFHQIPLVSESNEKGSYLNFQFIPRIKANTIWLYSRFNIDADLPNNIKYPRFFSAKSFEGAYHLSYKQTKDYQETFHLLANRCIFRIFESLEGQNEVCRFYLRKTRVTGGT